MGDYYGNSAPGGVPPNFSVPPPNFQNGPMSGPNYQNAPSQQGYPQQQQQQGNWGNRNDSSGGGYGGGNKDFRGGRDNNRGPPSYGNDFSGDRKNNFSGGAGNKIGYNKDGGSNSSGDMVVQEDTIFVSGMNAQTTEDDIANHFGAIGIIKKDKKTMKPKVWLYRNKETGESKGEATVTYDDANAAKSAISWFDNQDFNGATIHVSLAQRQNTWQKGGGFGNRGGNRGGGGGGGDRNRFDQGRNDDRGSGPRSGGGGGGGGRGSGGREGDWTCSSCNNTNFAWRNECNRCKEPKQNGGGGGGGSNPGSGSGGGSRFGGGRDGPPQNRGPPNRGGAPGGGGGGGFSRGGPGAGGSGGRGPMRGGNDRGNDRSRPY